MNMNIHANILILGEIQWLFVIEGVLIELSCLDMRVKCIDLLTKINGAKSVYLANRGHWESIHFGPFVRLFASIFSLIGPLLVRQICMLDFAEIYFFICTQPYLFAIDSTSRSENESNIMAKVNE